VTARSRPAVTLRDADDLIAHGLAPDAARDGIAAVAARYAVAVTPAVAALIDPDDPADPIARQYLPQPAELQTTAEERADPIGDHAHAPVPGVVHRYPDRVLLKLVHVCAVYCRFCFRREMVGPGKEQALDGAAVEAALAYVRSRPEIWEVILTGGDPLMLAPRRLAAIIAALGEIPHVKVVRLHSRVPVADPGRVTDAMVEALRTPRLAVWLALHANHPREFSAAAREACARFVAAGIPMVSQSVLLRGVNDDIATLTALMRCFVENRIKPYYLHHGDLAPGTAHLRTTLDEGAALMRALRGRVSGLCQPDYVLDIPGGHGKVPVGPGYLARDGAAWRVTDYCGEVHAYPVDGDR
jgi:lysine 2,3-aminomutase